MNEKCLNQKYFIDLRLGNSYISSEINKSNTDEGPQIYATGEPRLLTLFIHVILSVQLYLCKTCLGHFEQALQTIFSFFIYLFSQFISDSYPAWRDSCEEQSPYNSRTVLPEEHVATS